MKGPGTAAAKTAGGVRVEPWPGLSARLSLIAALIPEGSVVADIGTDHARLPVYLVATGRSPRVIATEANVAPLAVARRTVERFGVAGPVELRLGHGLRVLRPGEADVLVLAGLGGDTIAQILADRPGVAAAARRLVLQPMRSAHHLRAWLDKERFRRFDERVVADGRRRFEVLCAVSPGG